MQKAEQKAAVMQSSNAEIALRIKEKLLKKLEKEIDALPDLIGSETKQTILENEYLMNEKGKPIGTKPQKTKEATKAYRLRELTAAYRDLTSDMTLNVGSEPVRIVIDV